MKTGSTKNTFDVFYHPLGFIREKSGNDRRSPSKVGTGRRDFRPALVGRAAQESTKTNQITIGTLWNIPDSGDYQWGARVPLNGLAGTRSTSPARDWDPGILIADGGGGRKEQDSSE